MALNPQAVGHKSEPVERSWAHKDALLYALGVGAGALDPTGFELEFTTENSSGHAQRVLPTFAAVLGQGGRMPADLGELDMTKLVHGEQSVILHGEIPVEGTIRVTTTVAGMYDKGSGALIVLESESVDAATGRPAFTTRSGLFIREAGGFGGPRGPENDEDSALLGQPLEGEADEVVRYPTRTDQALLYRLSGDRNPLHSDPTFAKRAGFDPPILHGLCTYGFTGRALLHSVCGSDPARFGSMRARFSRPTLPGDTLSVSVWDAGDQSPGAHRFRTETQRGEVVIDGGLFRTAG